jgi:hypothetical protein
MFETSLKAHTRYILTTPQEAIAFTKSHLCQKVNLETLQGIEEIDGVHLQDLIDRYSCCDFDIMFIIQ